MQTNNIIQAINDKTIILSQMILAFVSCFIESFQVVLKTTNTTKRIIPDIKQSPVMIPLSFCERIEGQIHLPERMILKSSLLTNIMASHFLFV